MVMPRPRPGIKSKPARQTATPEQQDAFVGKAPIDPDNAPPAQSPPQSTGTATRKMGRPRKPIDPNAPKPRRVSLDLPPDLHARIKAAAALQGKQLGDYCRELVTQAFNAEQGIPPGN